ncbi:MAG: transporter, partial [Aestuariivirga sp.]
IALIAADLLIDGIVLGLAFVSGQKAGMLLTIALTIEVLFLGLSVAAELGQSEMNSRIAIGWTLALALMLPLGVMVASPIALLPEVYVTGAFAFGLIALLYLVTEELLVEAHEVEDRPWTSALFFVGFLLLIVLEDLL